MPGVERNLVSKIADPWQASESQFGHILGIRHCVMYRCLMNGSNSLEEADARSMRVCPLDLRKLQWNLGFDALTRERRLEQFFEQYGLSWDGTRTW